VLSRTRSRDPGLIRSAVEKLLRFYSPVETATERYAREDVTGGRYNPAGLAAGSARNSSSRLERSPDSAQCLNLIQKATSPE
jgi:hypothetical protein